ncbi:TetR/AcrR family transcriptional regulator [Bailinhaonella thermotolerans]|uniref:TetR/AcrR family transcriptional regulator n=1 Tax=Bailinhaonella thermotolerans TaxID=1070861 RepID=A0A3A4ATC4_9ACTN|nr:TetR/AcrR family transcriptional regulator [Bailinhaonella thermotolerans]RJL22812.1 TetR/AcrR family transcriptional regulator [Bailinhaonella thermotolerans]
MGLQETARPEPWEDSRSARKRRQILDAAKQVFLRNGYVGASMDEVASIASVSKQTVYKHFTDKEQLFTQLILDTTTDVDQITQLIAATVGDTRDLERDLGELARRFLGALLRPEVLRMRRLVIAEADRFPDLGRAWYEQGFERGLATLAGCFGRLMDRGLLRREDPLLAANHFVGLLLWIPLNHAMFAGAGYPRAEADRLAAAATDAFLRAYAP